MIRRLYERLTGRPWRICRSAAAEFGPPPGAVYAEALRHYTDAELIRYGEAILTQIREQQAAVDRILAMARQQHGRPEPELHTRRQAASTARDPATTPAGAAVLHDIRTELTGGER